MASTGRFNVSSRACGGPLVATLRFGYKTPTCSRVGREAAYVKLQRRGETVWETTAPVCVPAGRDHAAAQSAVRQFEERGCRTRQFDGARRRKRTARSR